MKSTILVVSRGFIIWSLEIKTSMHDQCIDLLFHGILPASITGFSINADNVFPIAWNLKAVFERLGFPLGARL